MTRRFYKIARGQFRRFAEISESGMQYAPPCPVCKRLGDRVPPLAIEFTDNKPLGDFVWLAPDVFISPRAKSVLVTLANQGIKFRQVKISGKRNEAIEHLEIVARCRMSYDCGVQLSNKCPGCGIETYSTWVGGLKVSEDCTAPIFRLVEYKGMIIVDASVKKLIENAGLTNITFIPVETITDKLAEMRPRRGSI